MVFFFWLTVKYAVQVCTNKKYKLCGRVLSACPYTVLYELENRYRKRTEFSKSFTDGLE
jgi:hypothetical protein